MNERTLTIISFTPQNDLVHLTETNNSKIFSGGDQRFHPYAPFPSSRNQFQIPNSIKTTSTDQHGQLKSSFLDKTFDYVPVNLNNEGIEYPSNLTPRLSVPLKKWLANRFKETDLFYALYEYFKDCGANCNAYFAELQTQQEDWFGLGLDITSLDTSIALIFGNKTTIGQVCSFAKGLKERTVFDVPGFCCLDAPYSSSDWGEKVRY
jgi:hypothetical protein